MTPHNIDVREYPVHDHRARTELLTLQACHVEQLQTVPAKRIRVERCVVGLLNKDPSNLEREEIRASLSKREESTCGQGRGTLSTVIVLQQEMDEMREARSERFDVRIADDGLAYVESQMLEGFEGEERLNGGCKEVTRRAIESVLPKRCLPKETAEAREALSD